MLKSRAVKILAILLTLGIAFSFGGCAKKSAVLDRVKSEGKIVLGTSADYAPYEFRKEVNGMDTIVGFDIEIAKEIAKDLGVQLEIKDMKFDGLLAALGAGTIDFVVAGMPPDPDRRKQVDFTKIYYTAEQGILVRAEDKDKYKAAGDFKGKTVGAQKSAIQEKLAKEQLAGAEVKALSKIPDLVLELKNKKVDALVVELPVATTYIAKNKDLVLSSVKVKDETGSSAIAVKKGNAGLIEEMNKTLDRLMDDKSIERFVTEASEAVDY